MFEVTCFGRETRRGISFHKFQCSLGLFYCGLWCLKCNGHKYSVDKVAECNGGKVTHYPECYNDNVKFSCGKVDADGKPHEEFAVQMNNVKKGCWCNQCSYDRLRDTIENMQELARKNGGKCLSIIYRSSRISLHWKCGTCKYKWWTAPRVIVRGSWCPKCRNNCNTIDDARKMASDNGGKCLSEPDDYQNWESVLHWSCNTCNFEWYNAYGAQSHRKYWCHNCADLLPYTIDDMHELAASKGGEFLSTEYINCTTPYLWKCDKNHTWPSTSHTIMNDVWCQDCRIQDNESKGSKSLRKFLTTNSIKFTSEKWYDDCKLIRLLYYDFYIPAQHHPIYGYIKEMIIEFDGEQHFIEKIVFGGLKGFQCTFTRDIIKTLYCLENSIPLIRVSYDCKNIIEYVENILRTNPNVVMQPLIRKYEGTYNHFRALKPSDRYLDIDINEWNNGMFEYDSDMVYQETEARDLSLPNPAGPNSNND